MTPTPRRMTRDEFLRFITERNVTVRVYVREPYLLTSCECGDVNCHGWRFVELEQPSLLGAVDPHVDHSGTRSTRV